MSDSYIKRRTCWSDVSSYWPNYRGHGCLAPGEAIDRLGDLVSILILHLPSSYRHGAMIWWFLRFRARYIDQMFMVVQICFIQNSSVNAKFLFAWAQILKQGSEGMIFSFFSQWNPCNLNKIDIIVLLGEVLFSPVFNVIKYFHIWNCDILYLEKFLRDCLVLILHYTNEKVETNTVKGKCPKSQEVVSGRREARA